MRAVFIGLLGLVAVTGCDNSNKNCADGGAGADGGTVVCGLHQTNVAGTCVNDPTVCGPNLAFDGDMGVCHVAPSACQVTGGVFDPASESCKPASQGTLVVDTPLVHSYSTIFTANTDAGAPVPCGSLTTNTSCTDPATVLTDKTGRILGGAVFTAKYPMIPGLHQLPTALDVNRHLTTKDWDGCGGHAAWYKDVKMPDGVTNAYKHVVDLGGCLPNTLYSVWIFWTPDGTRGGAAFGAASGGIPNVITTDNNGNGHFERLLDPNVWFKVGVNVTYAAAHIEPTVVFDPSNPTYANSGIITAIFWHSNYQTNDNMGFCVKDTDIPDAGITGNCLTPQPNVLNVLTPAIWAHQNLLHQPAVPIGMLQPY